MYKQIIIARKDLNMTPGKLAAQVSHGSMAFLTHLIKDNIEKIDIGNCLEIKNHSVSFDEFFTNVNIHNKYNFTDDDTVKVIPTYRYKTEFSIEQSLYEQWMCGAYTKCVLEAKNKNKLLKAVELAKELGMEEGKDFFLIWDNCYTELDPEEFDESGVGHTLTCIGFKPMDSEVIDKIGRKYHLYI